MVLFRNQVLKDYLFRILGNNPIMVKLTELSESGLYSYFGRENMFHSQVLFGDWHAVYDSQYAVAIATFLRDMAAVVLLLGPFTNRWVTLIFYPQQNGCEPWKKNINTKELHRSLRNRP